MIVLSGMGGIAPKITPELLPDGGAQVASNAILHKGGVAPLKQPVTVATPSKTGTKKSIYRFGKSEPENQYWFSWTSDVYACRGPVIETTERTYFSGDGAPKKTDLSLALSGGTSYPVAAYNLGVPAPTTAPTGSQIAGAGPNVVESRAFVFTNVTGWGEESGPSPAVIVEANSTSIPKLDNIEPIPTGNHNIVKRYIYRTVTSSSGTNYYWIGEIAAGVTTFTDNVDITAVGEPLATLDWDTPPDDLHGLIALPSGALCGLSKNQVCFSVVGAPYAWPAKYRLTCDYDGVAVAASGQGVYVLTTGNPYYINTGDPESAQMIRIDEESPCIAARSVVTIGGSVIYAAPTGLVSVSQSGSKIVTESIYDKEAWEATAPQNMVAGRHDGRYYGFFAGGGGFSLDKDGNFVPHDITATAVYTDPVLDQMYVAVGTQIQKWNSGSAKTATWRSKRFNVPPGNFACFKVKANSYANMTVKVTALLDTEYQANRVAQALGSTVSVSGNKVAYTTTVTGPEPQRLPSGFLARLWEFDVSGTDHWTSAAFANSIQELSNG